MSYEYDCAFENHVIDVIGGKKLKPKPHTYIVELTTRCVEKVKINKEIVIMNEPQMIEAYRVTINFVEKHFPNHPVLEQLRKNYARLIFKQNTIRNTLFLN